MKINYNKKQIEITKKEAKAASKCDSDTYKKLTGIKKDFPEYEITVREVSTKGHFKGFSFDKMEAYIEKYGTEKQKVEFKDMRKKAKETMGGIGSAYKDIRYWFNDEFPEATNFSKVVERISPKNAMDDSAENGEENIKENTVKKVA